MQDIFMLCPSFFRFFAAPLSSQRPKASKPKGFGHAKVSQPEFFNIAGAGFSGPFFLSSNWFGLCFFDLFTEFRVSASSLLPPRCAGIPRNGTCSPPAPFCALA